MNEFTKSCRCNVNRPSIGMNYDCKEVVKLPYTGSNPEPTIHSPINYLNNHEYLTLNR